ncbi:hypothetical protein GGQ74_000305 [Desulfobaculum xiamenense]|uniref:Uncharacterized protein n=1 Tax=Desulfobaculum xiamenense TaxID=995050 RepID=A0A846QML1_9BACT|nr:hypothetical protein [Desulfobaculum xiamenense]NJB66665.1 hypothetical protein [Desulfobaculum xiamenense]
MDIFFASDMCIDGLREGMGQLTCVGGVLVPEESLGALEKNIKAVCESHGVTGQRDLWPPQGGMSWDIDVCCSQILAHAAEHGVRGVVALWDGGHAKTDACEARNECATCALDLVARSLDERQHYGLVVAGGAEGPEAEDGALRTCFRAARDGEGCSHPERILLDALAARFEYVRLLQLAGIVVGVTACEVAGVIGDTNRLFQEVKPLLLRNKAGLVGGAGLRIFPNEEINLYKWVLGETYFSRIDRASGWFLPRAHFPWDAHG